MILFNLIFIFNNLGFFTTYNDFLYFSYKQDNKSAENLLIVDKNPYISTKLFKYYLYGKNKKYSDFFLKKLPETRESLFLQAKYYIINKRKKEAIPILKRLIFEYSEIKAFYILSRLTNLVDVNSKNIKLIEKLLEIDPYYIAKYKNGLIKYYNNDYKKLKKIFSLYLVYYPINNFDDILLLKEIGFSKIKYFYFLDKILDKTKNKNITKYYKEELLHNFHYINLKRIKLFLNSKKNRNKTYN